MKLSYHPSLPPPHTHTRTHAHTHTPLSSSLPAPSNILAAALTVYPAPSPTGSYDCCVYENSDPKPIVNDFCVDESAGCPSIPGWREVGGGGW